MENERKAVAPGAAVGGRADACTGEGEPRDGVEIRRALLRHSLGAGVAFALVPWAGAQENPRARRPQAGDRLVFAAGERKGQAVRPADVPQDARPLVAFPQDPSTGLARDASRLNQILLLRFPADALKGDTRARAAEGVVGYSAVCTHAGCDDWAWIADKQTLKCPCHDSEFVPADGARVAVGPATRRLAALPLAIADGTIVVAGEFIGRLGIQQ